MKTVTVQPLVTSYTDRHAITHYNQSAILRLRGRTVSDVFKPGQRVRVVRQMQNQKIVLVLEPA